MSELIVLSFHLIVTVVPYYIYSDAQEKKPSFLSPSAKLRSQSFSIHRRLSRRRSPPDPMAKKKKKPKINPEDETPSGSSASTGSQDSAQVSLELVADSTSDLRTLGFPVSSVSLAMSSKHIVDPSGAVAATIIDSAQSEPCYRTRVAAEASTSDIELIVEPTGAVTATITDAEPIVDSSSAVTATTTESSQRNIISEIQGTDFEAIVEPVGAITATITVSAQGNPNTEILDTVTDTLEEGEFVSPPSSEPATDHSVPAEIAADLVQPVQTRTRGINTKSGPQSAADHWRKFVKSNTKKLEPEGTPFTLDSGEACIRIPNSVIEKNKKAWDSFIIGKFYEEPPARGAVHAIVNGIWSKHRRDISVSKMDGHAFLFRVPCPNARRRILSQCLWQVDGQTMFVAKWSPRVQAEKPELSTVPVWLDFTGVPLQFFNRDALKEIAGLVGHLLCLHPSTENLTNIEVAKVYTVIDPRKPLPEAVNAQFDSGEVVRITVSSPWLPSLCSHCRKVGHTISKCPNAPLKCKICGSVKHGASDCTRLRTGLRKDKAPIASQVPIIGNAPSVQTSKKHVGSVARSSLPLVVKKKSSEVVHTGSGQEAEAGTSNKGQAGQTQAPARKDLLVVDLNGPGSVSFGHSILSSDSGLDSSSDSQYEDEDNPLDIEDRFIDVVTKGMKKSARKARVRGPLNL